MSNKICKKLAIKPQRHSSSTNISKIFGGFWSWFAMYRQENFSY